MHKEIHLFIIVTTGLFILFSCREDKNKPAFHQLEGGAKLAVHEKDYGEPVQLGNWLKMDVVQFYNDSVLRDSRQTGPEYHRYDSASMTPASLIAFREVKEGDSLEFKVPADSAFENGRPPFAQHKDGYLITRVKIIKIIRSEKDYQQEFSQADSTNRMPN